MSALTHPVPTHILEYYEQVRKRPPAQNYTPYILNQAAIEKMLPHRAPFLWIQKVHTWESELATIQASYNLEASEAVFKGHFPGQPIFPGVLQVEAIGQAGIIAHALMALEAPESLPSLTHILAARFTSAVKPGILMMEARVFVEGYFFYVVGQCYQDDKHCSCALVQGIA